LQLVDIIVGERTLLVALGVVKEGEGDEGERTHLQFVDISRYDAGWWLVALGAVLRWRCCGEGEGRCEKQKCRMQRFNHVFDDRAQRVQRDCCAYQEVTPLWT
jgi:hypothetical protein